jgi:hypothetical protein
MPPRRPSPSPPVTPTQIRVLVLLAASPDGVPLSVSPARPRRSSRPRSRTTIRRRPRPRCGSAASLSSSQITPRWTRAWRRRGSSPTMAFMPPLGHALKAMSYHDLISACLRGGRTRARETVTTTAFGTPGSRGRGVGRPSGPPGVEYRHDHIGPALGGQREQAVGLVGECRTAGWAVGGLAEHWTEDDRPTPFGPKLMPNGARRQAVIQICRAPIILDKT